MNELRSCVCGRYDTCFRLSMTGECPGAATPVVMRELLAVHRPSHTWEAIDERFWRQVEFTDRDGCWRWTGRSPVGRMKYGGFWLPGGRERVAAHRWAFERYVRPLVGEDMALHACDAVLCVRVLELPGSPAHVYAGTHLDNMADLRESGHGNGHPGEANGRAKLTNEQAAEIRRLVGQGVRRRDIAAAYDITRASVSRIVLGQRYAGV